MQFWLKENENNYYRLPVNPKDYTVTSGNNITTTNVNGIGEIALFSGKRLYSITLSSFFPNQKYSFCNYSNFPSPQKSIDIFKKWQNEGIVLRLIITDTKINMPVIIENFRYGERDGTGDVYFEIIIREYKYLTVKRSKTSGVSRSAPTKTKTNNSKTYTVVSGDSLWAIAVKFYGNGSKYTTIFNSNKSVIKNPNLIYPGQKLVIP